MDIDLRWDAFTVHYDPRSINIQQIEDVIQEAGFRPRVGDGRTSVPGTPERAREPVPEPIASSLKEIGESGQHLLIDFRADWCAPCRIMDTEILPHPAVRAILPGFRLLEVDVDAHPDTGVHFDVSAIPTLLVLDGRGREIDRLVGLIEPEKLARRLKLLRESSPGED